MFIKILPKPTVLRLRSYTVAYPTPKVMGTRVSCTALETDCLYAIYCTAKVNGMHASFESCYSNPDSFSRKRDKFGINLMQSGSHKRGKI